MIYSNIYIERVPLYTITGWWFQPSEKYESQLGLLFPIYGNIWKNKIKMFQTTNQFIKPSLLTITNH